MAKSGSVRTGHLKSVGSGRSQSVLPVCQRRSTPQASEGRQLPRFEARTGQMEVRPLEGGRRWASGFVGGMLVARSLQHSAHPQGSHMLHLPNVALQDLTPGLDPPTTGGESAGMLDRARSRTQAREAGPDLIPSTV
jgi:hypothetical protein